MSKKVTLKGGFKARIYLESIDNEYYIWAKDENNNKVGYCQFNLSYEFDRETTEEYKRNYAEYHKIPIDQVPNKMTYKVNNHEYFSIRKNKIVFFNNEIYDIKNTICDLQRIEILDERYFKTGLGYAMLKALESVAINNNCSQIEAFFSPYGDFSYGALGFYKRNGFEFYKHPKFKLDYIRKYLTPLESNANNNLLV